MKGTKIIELLFVSNGCSRREEIFRKAGKVYDWVVGNARWVYTT